MAQSRSGRSSRSYKTVHRVRLANPERRLHVLLVVIMMAITLFMGRAFQLQALDARAYAAQAARQMTMTHTLVPNRGQITDRNGEVLATSRDAVRVIANPMIIATNGIDSRTRMTTAQKAAGKAAPAAIAKVLAKHLGGEPEDYLAQLTRVNPRTKNKSQYEIIERRVDAWTYQQIAEELAMGGELEGKKVRAWYGIYKEDDPVRVYPAGGVAANVIGFVNAENKAAAGLERSLDAALTGVEGIDTYQAAAYGRIPLGNTVLTPAVDGTDFRLTIDAQMQMMAEQALAKGIIDAAAASGTAVVMNVKTGEVLALATAPSFDPNNTAASDPENLYNRVVTDPYEPGSVQKVITMAALADSEGITADTRVKIPESIVSGDGRITDAFSHKTLNLTVRGVVANSSNIGTVLLARQMDKAKFSEYLRNFGFGQRTGSGLPGEVTGTLPAPDMPDYTRDQVAFGQGISVTALQEAAAVATIANGGVYNSPRIIASASDGEGNPVEVDKPVTRRVISKKASAQVMDMMEAVITKIGGGSRAIEGYRTAGKSGTAERASNGGYEGYVSSFIGVAPAEDPQILVYVVLDQPGKGTAGSKIAQPPYQDIMKLALVRYGVKPSASEAPDKPINYEP